MDNKIIDIMGYRYTLDFSKTNEKLGVLGQPDIVTSTIEIGNNLSPDQLISTVLHEILEVLNYSLQLNLKHNVIMSLETGLYQTLKANVVDLSLLIKKGAK